MTPAGKAQSGLAHRTWNWSFIPKEPIAEGIVRQMIWGDRLMICRLTFAPGTITTAHDHLHEQMTIVEKGRVKFVVGAEEKVFGPGEILLFPGGFWHGASILDEEVVLLDIFSPIREDFLPKSGA
jgi:quercetin dioxygenase-like cupin family protein